MSTACIVRLTRLACAAGVCASAITLWSPTARSAGFFLVEQSVSSMGVAYAGAAALAQDATTIFFNPAGMTRLEGGQAAAGLHLVDADARFQDQGSFHLTGPLRLGLGRGSGGDASSPEIVPNLYYSHRLGDRLAVGIGVNAPFGLTTDYDDDWIGRYHADRSRLSTVNINPALALRLNDRISLGGGIDYQYVDAKLTSAVDLAGLLLPPLATRFDGSLTVEGSGWSWGWNLGALIELSEDTRVGVHYRSGVEHEVRGSGEISTPIDLLSRLGPGLVLRPDARSDVELPAIASASLFHRLGERWALMADVTWTEWSNLQELRFVFDGILPDGVEDLQWEDAFRYSLGAEYRSSRRWVWRAGVAYDESPIPGPEFRIGRLPDADRIWLAVGLGYDYSDRLGLDLGYAHLFVDDPQIDRVDPLEVARLKGEYDASVDILSAQIRWRFF
jgi:long-chain fatty acid transport protein